MSSASCLEDAGDEKTLPQEDSKAGITVPEEGTGVLTSSAPEQTTEQIPEAPFSTFSNREKKFIVITVSFMGIISPLSSAIYLPATPDIADDLDVSISLVNLTITTYMIFQGLAPSVVGNISDIYGRRPAYVICCVVYLAANIGLGVNRSYAGLMVLRCIQSCGSSPTIALGSAVVSDLVTRAERGKYVGLAGMGTSLGPALGPVIGGLITEYLDWPALFWFLAVLSGVLFMIVFAFIPETCRAVVGDGSIPCPWWNVSLLQLFRRRRATRDHSEGPGVQRPAARRKRPNPIAALKILGQKEAFVILAFGSLMYSGYFAVLTTLSNQLTVRFGFDAVTIGLCYLPIGAGSFVTRWSTGYLLDYNFRRHARKAGYEFSVDKQQDLTKLHLERARLEVSLPMIYVACGVIMAYGWAMETQAPLPGILVALFFCGLLFTGALNGFNVLVVDTNQDSPATAVAANNLFRCLISAGAVALATPLIGKIGIGWTSVFIAGLWIVFSPLVWAVMLYGPKWREEEMKKREAKKQARASREIKV